MDCWNCEYHDEEWDQGGGSFCICIYPCVTCSWPDECPKESEDDENAN